MLSLALRIWSCWFNAIFPQTTHVSRSWNTFLCLIKKGKNLEYQLKNSGKLNSIVAKNTLINQEAVADFLTDVFDYMKNSNFKL